VLGQAVWEAGSMLTFVAVPFQVYELTGSSLAVGLLGVAEFAPGCSVSAPPGSVLRAAWWSRFGNEGGRSGRRAGCRSGREAELPRFSRGRRG
jgi:hypothetical protein